MSFVTTHYCSIGAISKKTQPWHRYKLANVFSELQFVFLTYLYFSRPLRKSQNYFTPLMEKELLSPWVLLVYLMMFVSYISQFLLERTLLLRLTALQPRLCFGGLLHLMGVGHEDDAGVDSGKTVYFWTFLTYAYVETRLLDVIIGIIVVAAFSGMAMKAFNWSDLMIIKYIVYVNSVTGIMLFFTSIIYGYGWICFQGMYQVLISFSMVYYQYLSDKIVSFLGMKIRGKYAPSVMVAIAIILSVVDRSAWFLIRAIYGLFVGWFYLRFVQRHQDGRKGDLGDNFSFTSFFPHSVQKYVSRIADFIFRIVVRIKMLQPKLFDDFVPEDMLITDDVVTLPKYLQDLQNSRMMAGLAEVNARLKDEEEEGNSSQN